VWALCVRGSQAFFWLRVFSAPNENLVQPTATTPQKAGGTLRRREPLGRIETASKYAWQINALLTKGVFSMYHKQQGCIMSNNSISLPDVAETGMLTFYCHVIESQTPNPILLDEKAVEISRQLNPVFANSSSRLLRNLAKGKVKKELVVHINLRAKKYDEYARSFLIENPNGIIVNIGCGMDSRFQRIDNGKMTGFDLDLPEMIEFKKQFYKEIDRYHFIAASVFDYAWMDQVAKMGKRPVLFMAEGVFMYLDGEKNQRPYPKIAVSFPRVRIGM
jgi:O-methyltransferase involved in polyketide biosynthesis